VSQSKNQLRFYLKAPFNMKYNVASRNFGVPVYNSVEMVISIGHVEHMKVMSAELKTHLGKYLREVEQNRVTLEVCLRDRTVAYLVPAIGPLPVGASHSPREALTLAGIRLDSSSPRRAKSQLSPPVLAGDGREDLSSVAAMRGDRDW
jgi:antitoxin (DNA-binding transcriptional repressor) of toxin-antitoxin stability system